MTRGKVITLTVVIVLAAVFAAGWCFIQRGFSARDQPTAMETFIARIARRLATPPSMKNAKNLCGSIGGRGGETHPFCRPPRFATLTMEADRQPWERHCGGHKCKSLEMARFIRSSTMASVLPRGETQTRIQTIGSL